MGACYSGNENRKDNEANISPQTKGPETLILEQVREECVKKREFDPAKDLATFLEKKSEAIKSTKRSVDVFNFLYYF